MATSSSRGDRTWVMRALALVVYPILGFMARIRIHGAENMPRTGPVIAVPNHITEIDPIIIALVVYRLRRGPHFLAKKALFQVPIIGKLLKASGQIPVEREGGGGMAMRDSEKVLHNGGVIIVYPEATLTRDPDLWPMVGRTGAARMASENDAPIIPIAHWGTQNLLGRYEKKLHWWLPRTRIDVQVGEPIEIGEMLPIDFNAPGARHTPHALDAATDTIMHGVTAELEKLRGPKPSPELWADRTVPKSTLTPRGVSAEKVGSEKDNL